jgi:hypothetical protein
MSICGSFLRVEEEVVVVAKSLHPRKRAYAARRWQRVSTLENEHTRPVFVDGGGVSVSI